MDTQKDNTKKPQNDTSGRQLSVREDPHFAYITRKAEKLTTAVHLVTNFLPESEPLRGSIRQKSLELLSGIYSFKNKYVSDSSSSVSMNFSATIQEMVSMLRVAQISGFVSDMNFSILKREFDNLEEQLGSGAALSPTPQFADDYFEIDIESAPERTELAGYDATTSDRDSGRQKSTETNRSKRRTQNSTKNSKEKQSRERSKKSSRSSAKSKRRRIILGMFEENDEITVADVKEVIDGYSAKTIQRDLSALVEEGTLEKHGKRRWTSYKLSE